MMGKSRSATLICAYLMHLEPTRTPEIALELLRRYRPMAEPNEGFMEQLDLYYRMGAPDQVENQPIYQRWLFDRIVKESVEAGQAPVDIRFEDEEEPNPESSDTRFTCRKCRRVLASSAYLVSHQQKEVSSTVKALTKFEQPIEALDRTSLETKPISSKRCGHLFLDPLSWMKDELEQGKLEGRLECPKCKSNVGKYAWQGLRCTCNAWIVPGISLSRSRVDELKDLSTTRTAPSVKI